MYKTNINILIENLKTKEKNEILKLIVLNFRKHGNDYALGKTTRNIIRKKIGVRNEEKH